MSWYKKSQQSQLFVLLSSLRPQMAAAAQGVYNEWNPDPNEGDPTLGFGGICDEVSRAIEDVVVSNIADVNTTEGGQEGDDHSWIVVCDNIECYGVDISPNVYESGGGYSWAKRPGVVFQPQHVEVFKLDINPNDIDNSYD